jgi:hypothetical protein
MQRRKTEAGLGGSRPVPHPTQPLPMTADRSAARDRGVSCPTPDPDAKRSTGTRQLYRPAEQANPVGATIPAPPAESEEPPAVSETAPRVAARARTSQRPSAQTGVTRASRPRTSRPALRVDDVGTTAVEIANKVKRTSKPRLIGRASISDAPLSPQEAFVLSMIDGKLTIEALADSTGFKIEDVFAVVERLLRLKLVTC